MLTEKNFSAALKAMNFVERGTFFEKIFADNVIMRADLPNKKLFYPAQIKNRDRNSSFKDSNENLVVFECVNRLLDKGYRPEDIELERNWKLGHEQKSGRADICVSDNGKIIFIIECKTAGAEFDKEMSNMRSDGGQLFSYWQQEQSCQWLVLYTSYFDGELKFEAKSVKCDEKIYLKAHTVEDKFKIWSERYDKEFFGDVIFHDETIAYKIGVKPLRKRDLKNFSENQSFVNKFEEALRHNNVSDKENAFNRLIALFIANLVDESNTQNDSEVSFQFRYGSDTRETFQDRLQKLYAEGMKKFMGEDIFYLPEDYPDKLFANFQDEENHEEQIKDLRENFRKLKFYTNNAFAFADIQNEKLFRLNAKILLEVVDMLKEYRIIGSMDSQTFGDLFEQLLNKGFKQNEGQFFTPTPIAQFIWDSLPLEKIISDEPPKIIDYSCGAGHFLTEGFRAINDFYARKNLQPPLMWERDRLFGVEKDPRLATVSKISLFMHGANEGKIKFGDGLENYPDENILPANFDILVANPPYSVKGFKAHLKLENEFEVLDKISNDGSEIETLFVERISQLVKPKGFAAVILPSSILNKDGKSFVAARESLLKNFYIRAIVQLGGKTFGATSVSTIIIFLQKIFDPPERAQLFKDSAEIILRGQIISGDIEEEILNGYLKRTGKTAAALNETDREKIIYYALTYKQKTVIISAPDKNDEQEKFLGYGWSNAKGREGIVHKKRGGFLFDNDNRTADNTLAAVIRAIFDEKQLKIAALEEYYHYSTLADMLDFDSNKFTKTITLANPNYAPIEYSGDFETVKLGDYIEQIRGVSYKPEDLRSDLNSDSILLLRANNILDGKINHDEVQFVSREKVSAAQIIREGDILMSASSGSLKHVGKVAICTKSVEGETFGAFCKVIRSSGSLLSDYIAIYLSSPDCRKIIEMRAKGANINNIKNEYIDKLKIPLPSIEIQKKIVAEFDSIAAQTAQAEENIQNLDAAIKNKFAELFVGKNFPVKRLGEICKVARGGSPRPINDYITDAENGINWIKIGDATENSRYITKTAQRIKSEGKSKSRYVKAGDFLLQTQ